MEEVKEYLHQLIDTTKDDELLNLLCDIIEQKNQPGQIWNSLSISQKERTLAAEKSVKDKKGHATHSEMIERNKKRIWRE